MTDQSALLVRGLADLRGTAARAAKHRKVRRPMRRAGRHRTDAEALMPTLDHTYQAYRRAELDATSDLDATIGIAQPTLTHRSANILTIVMGSADTVLVAGALQRIDPSLSQAMALLLSLGISVALIALGKKIGTTLATFDRLHDQSTRWAVIGGLTATVILIGSAGLTLLRIGSPLTWPLLALAVPAGSASLTWLAYSPPWLAVERSRKLVRRTAQRHRRIQGRVLKLVARHTQLIHAAEVRFRSMVGRSLRRAILDGSLRADDISSHGRILDLLRDHHIIPLDVVELQTTIENLGLHATKIGPSTDRAPRSAA